MEEIVRISAKRKKSLKRLLPLLGQMGFTKIEYTKDNIIIEKVESEDLKGKPYLYYRVEMMDNGIKVVYSIPSLKTKLARTTDIGMLILNLTKLLDDYYDVHPSAMYSFFLSLLITMSKMMDKDKVELASELEGLKIKHATLEKRYTELVHSSEQNARILMECERKKNEQKERIAKLEGISDDALMESIFGWLKTHNGEIDIYEFSKMYGLPIGRIEYGLEILLMQGYIKKR
ncbi:hypothetical protein KAW38_00085 [Candidatus Micrarchaeota archaeon]|nr:hypothetical protein [Candidatus Micrarchaeota archaeon]